MINFKSLLMFHLLLAQPYLPLVQNLGNDFNSVLLKQKLTVQQTLFILESSMGVCIILSVLSQCNSTKVALIKTSV